MTTWKAILASVSPIQNGENYIGIKNDLLGFVFRYDDVRGMWCNNLKGCYERATMEHWFDKGFLEVHKDEPTEKEKMVAFVNYCFTHGRSNGSWVSTDMSRYSTEEMYDKFIRHKAGK